MLNVVVINYQVVDFVIRPWVQLIAFRTLQLNYWR